MTIFKNQALDLTLTCKDEDGAAINLTGKTMSFLYRDPSGTVTTDTGPTVGSTSGTVLHSFTTTELGSTGSWMAKAKIETDDIYSTRYEFWVVDTWDA